LLSIFTKNLKTISKTPCKKDAAVIAENEIGRNEVNFNTTRNKRRKPCVTEKRDYVAKRNSSTNVSKPRSDYHFKLSIYAYIESIL